jgi:hypothetical protein
MRNDAHVLTIGKTPPRLATALFFLILYIFFSTGRVGAGDATGQLDASVLFVRTASLASPSDPENLSNAEIDALWGTNYAPHSREFKAWGKGRVGYYQPHDIGESLFLIAPAGLAAALADVMGYSGKVEGTRWVKFVAALSHSALASLACFFLYLTFMEFYGHRVSFLLSLVFGIATCYLDYTKHIYDVVGCAVGTAYVLHASARLLCEAKATVGLGVQLGLALALATMFRYSVGPFLGLSVLILLWLTRLKWGWKFLAALAFTFLLGSGPTFWYNSVRTGNPFLTALLLPKHGTLSNRLDGSLFVGLLRLTVFPARGLLFASPVFALLLASPWTWKEIPRQGKQLVLAFSAAALGYTAMIAKMSAWHGYTGLGPRYIIPILPILFLPLGMTLVVLWNRRRRLVLVVALSSMAINLSLALIDTHIVCFSALPNTNRHYAFLPYQQIKGVQAVLMHLRGIPLPIPDDFYYDGMDAEAARQESLVFPDFWTVRLMREPGSRTLGITAFLSLIASVLVFGWVACQGFRGACSTGSAVAHLTGGNFETPRRSPPRP